MRKAMNASYYNITDQEAINMQFRSDTTNWHYDYTSGDSYFRISRDLGATWGNAVSFANEFQVLSISNDTVFLENGGFPIIISWYPYSFFKKSSFIGRMHVPMTDQRLELGHETERTYAKMAFYRVF